MYKLWSLVLELCRCDNALDSTSQSHTLRRSRGIPSEEIPPLCGAFMKAIQWLCALFVVSRTLGTCCGFLLKPSPRLPHTADTVTASAIRLSSTRESKCSVGDKKDREIMEFVLYNTMERKKRPFKPMTPRKVKFYSCGPTVYDFAHVGNFRAFITYDLLKRWLEYCGYEVDHVCNLTDIDDKIIAKMESTGLSMKEITDKYTQAFFDDLDVLNIKRAHRYPKATEHIDDIREMIQSLIDKEYAYVDNGSVYFRVSKFKDYGKLGNLDFEGMEVNAGGAGPNERRGTEDKESKRDFALWKARSDGDDSGVLFQMPWGTGRPGKIVWISSAMLILSPHKSFLSFSSIHFFL